MSSGLHIPPQVADAMRALRPELRKKLSLRDIDDMTRSFRQRIKELEECLTMYGAKEVDVLRARIKKLEEKLDEARAYAGHWRDVATDLNEQKDPFPWEDAHKRE